MGQVQLPTFNFDPTKWVQDAFGALLQTFSDGIRSGLDALWAANFITQTPPSLSYQNEDIRGLYGTMQRVGNAALALIATFGALNMIVRPYFGRLRYSSLVEFVPRFLVGRHPGQHRTLVVPVCDRPEQRAGRCDQRCSASELERAEWRASGPGGHRARVGLCHCRAAARAADADAPGLDRCVAGGLTSCRRMLGAASNAGLGAELERAIHRGGLHAVRSSDCAQTRRNPDCCGGSDGAERQLADVSGGCRDAVAHLAHPRLDARWGWRKHRRYAGQGAGPAVHRPRGGS